MHPAHMFKGDKGGGEGGSSEPLQVAGGVLQGQVPL